MTPIKRIWIDELACIATEARMLVETHVFLRRDDYYVPDIAADAANYFESHRRQIIGSVLSCPVGAISLEFADGKIITAFDYNAIKGIDQWVDY
jgi:hypothetical protein